MEYRRMYQDFPVKHLWYHKHASRTRAPPLSTKASSKAHRLRYVLMDQHAKRI